MFSKTLNLIKTNLPGITVALGICAFLYEGLIKYNPHFIFTKYAAVLIFFVIYNNYGDKSADLKSLPKCKYDLNWEVLLRYLKKRLNDLPIQVGLYLILYFWDSNKTFANEYVGLLTAGFIEGFFSYAQRQRYITELAEKGQTEKEVNNLAFIKSWDENRERGFFKYCLVDGAIIAGAILSIGVGIVGMIIFKTKNDHIFSNPGEMFSFIGYSYLIGAIISSFCYTALWFINQNKFMRLTDPLH